MIRVSESFSRCELWCVWEVGFIPWVAKKPGLLTLSGSPREKFFKIRLGTKKRTQTWKLQKHLLAGRSKRIQNRGCTPTHRFRWLRPWWPTWWCCRSRAWQCPPAGRWGTACKIGRNISFRLVSILWSLMPKLILNSSCSGTGRPYGLAGAQRLLMQAP